MGKEKENPIKVFARVRPLTRKEIKYNEDIVIQTYFENEKKIKIIDRKHIYESTYMFDRVFSAADTNETVFTYTTKNFISKLLNGTNCSLIAYGQTGSGKTHTLMADGGVTDYTISDLFRIIGQDRLHRYKVTCSFVQIYLEKVFDILGSNSKLELPVREHPDKGIHVQGLTEHEVYTAKGVYDLFNLGKEELMKAETEMEHLSSRSHSIFQLSIERSCDIETPISRLDGGEETATIMQRTKTFPDDLNILEKGTTVAGKVAICDLAGSERFGKTLVERTNQNEAKYINSSLLQLGNVIYALSDRKRRRHIPFRNSTLTRMLQECLGSKCITAFIICVAPSCKDVHETVCSLNFGARARTITNKVRVFTGRAKQEFLNNRLSSKIFLLENRLRLSARKRNALADQYTQTEITGNTYGINSYIDITKRSLELSGLLDLFVKSKRGYYKSINRNNRNKDIRCSERTTYHDHDRHVYKNDFDHLAIEDDQILRVSEDYMVHHLVQDGQDLLDIDDIDHHVEDSRDYHSSKNRLDGRDYRCIEDSHDLHVNKNHNHNVTNNEIETSMDYEAHFEKGLPSEHSDDCDEDYDVNDNCILDNGSTIHSKPFANTVDGSDNAPEYQSRQLEKNEKTISIFVVATKHISSVLMELQKKLENLNSRQSKEIINTLDRCRRRLEYFQNKIIGTNIDVLGHQFLEDTNISISELCCDIKYNIKSIMKRMDNVIHVVQSMENTSAAHAWFANLNNLLNTLDNNERCFVKGSNVCYIYYLVYLLQLLQIIRLSLVYSSKTLKTQKRVFTSKPVICSTSLEDVTVSPTNSVDPIDRFARIPRINVSRNSRDMRSKQESIVIDCIEEKERIARRKNYVCKLYRQPAIKIKQQHLNSTFSNTLPKLNKTFNKSSDSNQSDSKGLRDNYSIDRFRDCEKKRKSTESRVKRSRSFEVSREYVPPTSQQLISMYDEIRRKYEEAVEENNVLWSNMKSLEDEDSVSTQRKKLEEQISSYCVENKRKEDELVVIKRECMRYKRILERAEEVLHLSTCDVLHLEALLAEKNERAMNLEAVKQTMNDQKEEHIEQYTKMEEIREGIILFQQIFESCISLSEELLFLSTDLEEAKILYGKKNLDSIKDLESEVFRLMQSNVRYENVLDDIRNKVKFAITNIDTMQKVDQCQSETGQEPKTLKEQQINSASLVTNQSSTRQDASKFTEMILSCDDEMIQTILIDDLRHSTDKHFAVFKDIKASLLIKQLLRDKSNLEDTVKEMKNKLIEQDVELAQNKQKIELFVKELGKLDQQLNREVFQPQYCYDFSIGGRYANFTRSHEQFDIIHVPGMCYDKFTLYLNYYTNGLPPPRAKPVPSKPPEGVQMILVEELDELKSEIDFYKRKCKEIETQYNKLSTCLEQDLAATNKSLICKIEYLKHVNSIIEKENRNIKNRNIEQKNQVKILKDANSKIEDQVEVSRCQSKQIQAKTEISRLHLEKKLSKYKEKLNHLGNYIDVMREQKEALKRHFDDSGLPPDDSDNYTDITC